VGGVTQGTCDALFFGTQLVKKKLTDYLCFSTHLYAFTMQVLSLVVQQPTCEEITRRLDVLQHPTSASMHEFASMETATATAAATTASSHYERNTRQKLYIGVSKSSAVTAKGYLSSQVFFWSHGSPQVCLWSSRSWRKPPAAVALPAQLHTACGT